jgi:hypothetical protein
MFSHLNQFRSLTLSFSRISLSLIPIAAHCNTYANELAPEGCILLGLPPFGLYGFGLTGSLTISGNG